MGAAVKQSCCILVLDGVLRKPDGHAPIMDGLKFYRALSGVYDIVLILPDEENSKRWLLQYGVDKHIAYSIAGEHESRVHQVSRLRRQRHAVDLVVEPDPKIAAELHRAGFTVCVFACPSYGQIDWRPDEPSGIPSWDQLADGVKQDQAFWAKDERLGE